MKRLFCLLLMVPLLSSAQFSDDFADGDFVNDPVWQGDTEKFVVNSESKLQLNDNQESSAFLSTGQQRIDSTEWLFEVNLDFAPSANNNARIYLASSSVNPAFAEEALYLQMGESGSDDALELYHYSEGEEHAICRGSEGLISSPFTLNVKITFQDNNLWRIYIDPVGDGTYILDAEGSRPAAFTATHFSVMCNYTISNSENFTFDNFIVRTLQVDVTPPEVEDLTVISDSSLLVTFSEALNKESAENTANYTLDDEIHPSTAILDDLVKDKVTLTFDQHFNNQTDYMLRVSGISDIFGNVMASESHPFTYLQPFMPEAFDVVINELMTDVNPEPDGLPAYDYVELFNTTDKLIDLSGTTLSWGARVKEIPAGTEMSPGSYLVLTDDDAVFEDAFPRLLFSTFPVNNEAQMTLKTASHTIIHSINYEKSWYHDEEKEDGGWSLEMIDPQNPCGGANNYRASQNTAGGTPGTENSVYGYNPDTTRPRITYARILSDTTLALHFSEKMDTIRMDSPENYTLNPMGATPESVNIKGPGYEKVVLYFSENLNAETKAYSIITSGSLSDCAGNLIVGEDFTFSNYHPEYGDVVINEIMADVNPAPPELPPAEYLEIYNRSNFPVDLSSFRLYSGNTEINIHEGVLIAPSSYLVISEASLQLDGSITEHIYSKLSISNNGEAIFMEDENGAIIHYINFHRTWYDDPAKEEGGWALEMIDANNVCGQHDNWKASAARAGGTPGAPNSIVASNPDTEHPDILRIAVPEENRISVYFDEPINHETLSEVSAIEITPSDNPVTAVSPVKPAYNAVDITFEAPLQPETTYTLDMRSEVEDCAANSIMVSGEVYFSYPLPADSGNVVINEILFNDSKSNSDFIELYNTSGHAIDLSSLFILQKDPQTGTVEKKVPVTPERLILVKESFIALTSDRARLRSYYTDSPKRAVLQVEGFPNLHSSEGIIAIESIDNQLLDEVHYHEDMHFGLIDNYQDVSLERIDPYKPSSDGTNWHSASEQQGYATPGERNSQYLQEGPSANDITITPKIITPNNDGKDDVAAIAFNFEKAGYAVNITIFDARGRKVALLVNNYLPGTSGRIFWDGTDENHQVVSSGYYILIIELFDLKGSKKHFKKTVVVSGGR